jgi:hypothetical protein
MTIKAPIQLSCPKCGKDDNIFYWINGKWEQHRLRPSKMTLWRCGYCVKDENMYDVYVTKDEIDGDWGYEVRNGRASWTSWGFATKGQAIRAGKREAARLQKNNKWEKV